MVKSSEHVYVVRDDVVGRTSDHVYVGRDGVVGRTSDHVYWGRGDVVVKTSDHVYVGRGGVVGKTSDHVYVGRGGVVGRTFEYQSRESMLLAFRSLGNFVYSTELRFTRLHTWLHCSGGYVNEYSSRSNCSVAEWLPEKSS